MPQNNQEIYESLFNSNEEFKNAFPSQQNFEEYISTSPSKLDKIYNRFGTPSPITVPDPADEPVKKKEKGSFFRSLFSGGKNKPQVEGGSLTPLEATPVSEQPVVPILPRAKVTPGPVLDPELALDEYYSAVKLDDEAKQSEAIASFGSDVAQGVVDMTTKTGEVIANMSLDLAQDIEERFRVSSRKNVDLQWEPVKLAVPIDVIEKQGRRKLTYGLVLEKEKEAKKAAKSIIEQSLLNGGLMTEEIGKYMDKDTKEEKGWPVLTPESKQLVMELSENKDLSTYRPEEEGKVGLAQLVKESRVPNVAKIEEYALIAFKQYKPNVEGVGLQRADGTLIASDEEIKNDPRFQIIKETLIDMVTDGIQRDNFESAFDIELKKEFPDNKEIQEKGIRALSAESAAMLQNTAATFNKKSEQEFNAYVATKSAPFLKLKAEKSALVESAFASFKQKYDYDENLKMYFGGNRSEAEFEKDKKDLEKLVDAVNQELYENSIVLQKEIENYQQSFIKDQEVKLTKEMQSLGVDIDNRIKKIAKRVGQEVSMRQKLAEQNAFEQNSLVQNMVNAYAAGSADQFRGYSLMIRTITGGRSMLTDALEDLADMSYMFETSVQTQWYKSKDENGKKLGWWDAIKNSFKDIETSKETISEALVETARMAPAMVPTIAVGAAGGGFGLTMATSFLTDTSMEMVEGYKGALATSGNRRIAEMAADKIYKKQLGYLTVYTSDAVTFTPKSLGRIANLSDAARIAGAKLAINQLGETMQEVHQGFGQEGVKSELLGNKPFTMSFTDYAKENSLDLSMAVLPQTLLFGSVGSAVDTYSQLTQEKRAQDAIRLFDELGFTNYIMNATRDLGRSGALAMGEMMYIQGQISLEQAQKFQQAAIRLTEFSEAAEMLAPNSAQRSHAIVGLMSDKYEQQNRLNSVTTEQAKDQIKDEIKKIDAEIENIKNGKMDGYSVITDVKSGRIIAALSDIKLKKLMAGNNQEAYSFLTQVALGGFSLNTKDLKIKDLVDRYKVFLDNSADTKKKIADVENKKEADKLEAAEKRKAGQKDVPTDEEIDAKANAEINNISLESFVPVFLAQTDVNNDLREYKEKQVVNTSNIDIPNTIEINEKTTPQEIDNFVLGADNHQKVNMAIAQVKAVMPLMQSMFPNSKIVIVKGDEQMKQISGSDTLEEGFFYQGLEQTYEGSKTNKVYDTEEGKKLKSLTPTIYLNLQRMTEFTLYHETVHAALLKAFGADPTLMKNFKGGVESILDKNMKARLDKWLADRNYSDTIKDEEYLAQLGAFLKSEGKNIKMSMWQQLKGLILTTLNKMGFKSLENRVNTFYDAKQMVDFFNQLTKGQITGVTADSFVPFDAPAEQKQRRSRTNAEDTATETLGERARRSGMVRFSYTPSSQQAFQYLDEMMNHAVDKYGFKKKEDSLDGDKRYTDFSRANRMVHIGLDKSINIAPNANLNTNDLLSVTNRLMVNIVYQSDKTLWQGMSDDYRLYKSEQRESQEYNLKTDYLNGLQNELEKLRDAYAQTRRIENSPYKEILYMDGEIPEVKSELVDAQRKYRKEKALLKANLPRERGVNFIIEKLSNAVRNTVISQQEADLAIDLLRKNPAVFEDLAISITKGDFENRNLRGYYNSATSLVKLFKNQTEPTTATHELLHHTEKFLPESVRTGIILEWGKAVNSEIKKIQAQLKGETDTKKRKNLAQGLLFLNLAKQVQTETDEKIATAKEKLMKKYMTPHMDTLGDFIDPLDYSYYKFYNPSEWWAVNASRLFQESKNNPELKTWVDKARAFYTFLIESIKKIFKGSTTAAVEKGLDVVLSGKTLSFDQETMLANVFSLPGMNSQTKGTAVQRVTINSINNVADLIYRFTNNDINLTISERMAAEKIWDKMSNFFVSRPVSHLGGAYNILSAWSSQQPTAQKQALNEEEVLESIRNNAEVPANEQISMFMDGVGNLIPSQVRKSLARTEFALGLFDTLANKFPELKIDTLDNNARLEAVKKAFENGDISEKMYERAMQIPALKRLRVNDLGEYTIHYDNLDDLMTAYSLVLLFELRKFNPNVWANILDETERKIPEMKEVFERFRSIMTISDDVKPSTFKELQDEEYNKPEAEEIIDNEIMPYLANLLADNAKSHLTANNNNQVDLANRIVEDLKNGFNQRDDVNYNILPASTGLEQLALLLIDPKVKLKSDFYERTLSETVRSQIIDKKELKRVLESPDTKLLVDPLQGTHKAITLDSTKEEKTIAEETVDSIINNLEFIIENGENSQEYIDAANLGYWPSENFVYLDMLDTLVVKYQSIASNMSFLKSEGRYTQEFEAEYTKETIKKVLSTILFRINEQPIHRDRQPYIDSLIKLTGDPKIIEKIQPLYKPLPTALRQYISMVDGTAAEHMILTSSMANSMRFTQDQHKELKEEILAALARESKNLTQKGKIKREGSFFIYDDNGNVIDEMTTDGTLVDEGPGTVKGIYMNFESRRYGYGNAPSGKEADSQTKYRRNVVTDAASILLGLFSDENISYISFIPSRSVPEKYKDDPARYRQKLYGLTSQKMQKNFAQAIVDKEKIAEIEKQRDETLAANAEKRLRGEKVPTDEEVIKAANKALGEVAARAQVIPISPVMRGGGILESDIYYDKRFKPLDKSQIRQSQAANHQKIKQEVESMRQQNVPDADIFASLFIKYGYEDMRTSAFGTDFMNAADAFIDAKAEEGLNKYANEFAKRQTGIRNFLDAYYGTAPLLTLVNKLREGVLFVDDTNYALPAGMTYLFDPNSVQLRETSQQEGKIYKFADYEIFRSLFDAGETSSTLSQIFGPQFRETIQRVLDRNEMASDILTGLEQDARSLKVKRSIEELRELGEIFDDMDATAIVKWLVNKLATGGIEEAVQVLIDRLNSAETFADLEDQMNLAFYESAKSEDIQALSGLGSFAGRVLRLMRQVAKKPEQLIIENAESRGLVIPPKLKAQIEEASKKKIQAYEDYKKALKTFMEDFNDLNGLALIAAEKNYDDMAFEFARIVNVTAVQPGFWSNNLIKASAFALLSVNTVFVSGVSVMEILGRTLALPSALTRFLADKYIVKAQINPTFGLRAQTNPFTKAYWRNAKNAFAYTAQPSFYEMARVMATGQQQNKNISLVDQPTNMNSFRDAHNIVQLFMRYLDKQKGPMSVEEIADYMETALLEVQTGQVNAQGVPTTELKLADSFVIMNTFFRGILAQPALGQSELMVRLMPLGLDRFGANAIAMNSMLTYINLQMENDYANMPESLLKALQRRNAGYAAPSNLPSVPGQPIPNTNMDEVTLQKNMSRLMAGLFATGQLGRDVFETEALKATFFSDNSITRGVSSIRTGLQKRMKDNYYRYLAEKRKGKEGSFISKASSAAALHLNQVGNVAQFAVLPFVKVPSNIGIAVLTRSNPISAMLHSVAMGSKYNEVFREMKDKYKLNMTANTALTIPGNMVIPNTPAAKQIEVEKDMMRLYEAKRKYLQSVGDITGSTIFAGAVYMVVMSGAVTPSDDPDKRTLMSEMGLKSSELNVSYLKDYLLESAKRREFVDGKEFARKRGKANPNDLKINLINLGTYLSYGLGFGADLYQANQTRQNESNDLFEGMKSYYTYGTVFQNMTRTLFKMTPSVKFIEDVLQVLDTNQGKKDWGKDMDDIAGSLFATVGAAAAPSLLGKPLSVSEAQVIQGPKDIEVSKEVEKYPWPLNIKPVLIAHMRMSRNGIIFPGFLRSDFYMSGIGTFGEDLTLRRTLNAPNTGAAYAESMLNFFSMRREAIVTPEMATEEFVRHQEVQSFVSGISYLATVYFQLEKDPTNFYKAFNRPGKNSFILTDSPEGERGENVNKPIKLPNDIFRDEARILGSYRYAIIEEFNTEINNFIEDVKTRKIETPEEKEQLALEISKYMDRLVQKMSDVENQYKSDFLLNRANDIAGELERRRVLVKNAQQDEKQRLIEIGVAPEVFENINLYRWTPSFDKQGRIIKPKTSESISKLKK